MNSMCEYKATCYYDFMVNKNFVECGNPTGKLRPAWTTVTNVARLSYPGSACSLDLIIRRYGRLAEE